MAEPIFESHEEEILSIAVNVITPPSPPGQVTTGWPSQGDNRGGSSTPTRSLSNASARSNASGGENGGASGSNSGSDRCSTEPQRKTTRISEVPHKHNILFTPPTTPPGTGDDKRRASTNTSGTHTPHVSKSFLQRNTSCIELGDYVDSLPAEDVGFSFCIRAPADFSKESDGRNEKLSKRRQKKRRDEKHLYGLENIFPKKAGDEDAEQTPEMIKSSGKSMNACQHGALPQERIDPSQSIASKLSTMRMPYSAISEVSSRVNFALSTSAVLSFLYVIGYCAVQPACNYGGVKIVVWAHLINSVIYGLTAIPSRGLFTRIDWRIGEELTSAAEVLTVDLRSPGLYFDIVALIGLVAEIAHLLETFSASPLPTPLQWLMMLQLLKVWRVLLPEETADSQRNFLQGILKLLFSLLVFAHITGCAFLLIGHLEMSQGSESWLDKHLYNSVDMNHCVVRYTEAFYFAVIGLTSVGYGDLMVTSLEHNLNAFFLLISQLFAAKICAELTWLTSMYNQHESDVHERRRSLVLALDKMGAPKVLVRRVLAFQVYENTFHADNMENETFQGLSKNLTAELRLCTYRKLVIQAPFLREQPTEVISIIVNSLSDAVYLPSDFIVRAGEPGRELFFVRRGEARAYLGVIAPVWGQSDAVAVMKTGSYFGELAMLTGFPRGSFVMATNYCICSILPYSAVEDLVDMHPEAFTTLVQTMVRMYKLKPKETWHGLTAKIMKTVGVQNDHDAYEWFRSHSDFPEVEELEAKAFDLALMRLKVSHLDRRIFWSELDKDAKGGIDYKDFKGKLHFRDDSDDSDDEDEDEEKSDKNSAIEVVEPEVVEIASARNQSLGSSTPFSPPAPSPSAINSGGASGSFSWGSPAGERLSCESFTSIAPVAPGMPGSMPGSFSDTPRQPAGMLAFSESPRQSTGQPRQALRIGGGNQAGTSDEINLKSLALLLEQNTRLLSEVQKLNLTA